MSMSDEVVAAPRRVKHSGETDVVMFVLVGLTALVAYHDVFGSWRNFVGPTFGGVIGGSIVAFLLRRRFSIGRAFAVALVVGAVFVIYSALVDTLSAGIFPGGDTIRALRDGIAHGFSDALGDSLPLRDRQGPLVLISALSWLCGFTTTDICLRSRLAAVPLIPPIVLMGLSLPLSAPLGGPSVAYIAIFVALSFLAVLLRATPDLTARRTEGVVEIDSRSLVSSRLTVGIPLVAIIAILCPFVADVSSSEEPFDPRELRGDLVANTSILDPLAEYKAIVSRVPAQSLFRVNLTGASALDVVRMPAITLDIFDGVRWTSSGRFQKQGTREASEAAKLTGTNVTAHVFVGRLPNLFLPTVGAFEEISQRDLLTDPDSGDGFTRTAIDGTEYFVDGRLNTPSPQQVAAAAAATDEDTVRYTTISATVPNSIRELAQEVTVGSPTAGQAILKLDAYLRDRYTYDETAQAGSSFGRLERFLSQDHTGTAEQFATSFAVLARVLGYPTRVVLGYRITEEQNGAFVPIDEISTADYHVWAEVKLEGLGWVTVDPTPKPGQVRPPIQQRQATAAVQPEGGGGSQQPREVGPSEAPTTRILDRGYVVFLRRVAIGIGVVLLAALCLAAAVLLTKRVRRSRRRTGTPNKRIAGAWDEFTDRLAELGVDLPPSLTPREVSRAATARFGADTTLPVVTLSRDLSRAVYGREQPTSEMADSAWQLESRFEENLWSSLGRRERLAARFSIVSLVRRESADTFVD
jgi:transglutaminase-like putative cysteine protease/drug/metabolite transporter (DMT)-like permease